MPPTSALTGADKRHAIALQEATEGKIEESWLESDPESVHTWARSLGERFEGAKIAVGVELSKGALIEELRSYNFIDIYPLNPSRRKLVDMRTDLCNTLRCTLKGYYPLALEVGGELGTLLNCKFLIKWSSVDELKRARRHTLRAFYHANGSRRADTIEGRLDKVAAASLSAKTST